LRQGGQDGLIVTGLRATVIDCGEHLAPGVSVSFIILSGPNSASPLSPFTGITNAFGEVDFTYTSISGQPGIDHIHAEATVFTDRNVGGALVQNDATKTWVAANLATPSISTTTNPGSATVPPAAVLNDSATISGPPAARAERSPSGSSRRLTRPAAGRLPSPRWFL
jgi:hypothetical protein